MPPPQQLPEFQLLGDRLYHLEAKLTELVSTLQGKDNWILQVANLLGQLSSLQDTSDKMTEQAHRRILEQLEEIIASRLEIQKDGQELLNHIFKMRRDIEATENAAALARKQALEGISKIKRTQDTFDFRQLESLKLLRELTHRYPETGQPIPWSDRILSKGGEVLGTLVLGAILVILWLLVTPYIVPHAQAAPREPQGTVTVEQVPNK